MKKRAQAAMEFLMTYGWAILVVIAAIAALAYFGVLSPDQMLPERTTFQAPVPSVDNAVVVAGDADAGTVTIPFKNNVGFTINITDVSGADEDCNGVGTGDKEISVAGGAWQNLTVHRQVTNGQAFRVRFTCSDALTAGEQFKSDVTIDYVNTESYQEHKHQGTINGKVAPS